MSAIDASGLLRPGLLEGVSMLVLAPAAASSADPRLPATVRDACAELGASVHVCEPPLGADSLEGAEAAMDEAVERALSEGGDVQLLVVDCGALFEAGAASGAAALGDCLLAAWNATRAVATRAFLERDGGGGRILLIAPPSDAGEHAGAARAAVENLARTLSIEWARHAITVVAIAPRSSGAEREVAALAAYLASPAGAYFSGCVLEPTGAR
jgi:NAD(P)-dependent dehydrogenase (short-subunit alcohol dehydrogenase family)